MTPTDELLGTSDQTPLDPPDRSRPAMPHCGAVRGLVHVVTDGTLREDAP